MKTPRQCLDLRSSSKSFGSPNFQGGSTISIRLLVSFLGFLTKLHLCIFCILAFSFFFFFVDRFQEREEILDLLFSAIYFLLRHNRNTNRPRSTSIKSPPWSKIALPLVISIYNVCVLALLICYCHLRKQCTIVRLGV